MLCTWKAAHKQTLMNTAMPWLGLIGVEKVRPERGHGVDRRSVGVSEKNKKCHYWESRELWVESYQERGVQHTRILLHRDRDIARSSMESWLPTSALSYMTQDTRGHAVADFLYQGLSNNRSLRSIPTFTMRSWMNHEYPTQASTNWIGAWESQSLSQNVPGKCVKFGLSQSHLWSFCVWLPLNKL